MQEIVAVSWEERETLIKSAHAPVHARDLFTDYLEALAKGTRTQDFLKSKNATWSDMTVVMYTPTCQALYKEAVKRGELLRQRLREEEADRRALDGTKKPVFHKGEICGYIREYSDSLLALQLKAGNPDRYADRSKVEHKGIAVNYNIQGVKRDPKPGDPIEE